MSPDQLARVVPYFGLDRVLRPEEAQRRFQILAGYLYLVEKLECELTCFSSAAHKISPNDKIQMTKQHNNK